MAYPILTPGERDFFGLEPETFENDDTPAYPVPLGLTVLSFSLQATTKTPCRCYEPEQHAVAAKLLDSRVADLKALGLMASWWDLVGGDYKNEDETQVPPWLSVTAVLAVDAEQGFRDFAAACVTPEWRLEEVCARDDLDGLCWGACLGDAGCRDDEDPAEWATRRAIPREKMERLARQMAKAKGDTRFCSRLASSSDPRHPKVRFLVDGLIPRGEIGLIAGKRKHGKSTACLQLALALSEGHAEWLGQAIPLDARGVSTVFISGEDSEASNGDKIQRMTSGRKPENIVVMPQDQRRGLQEILDEIWDWPVGLLIIDPAIKYVVGSENSSEDVDRFFSLVERFAEHTGATVLVVHHILSRASPASLEDVARSVRGSGVFLDRPRFMLALCQPSGGALTQVGIPSPDGQPMHNFDGEIMHRGPIALRFDRVTRSLVPEARVNAAREAEADLADTAAVDAAVAAIGRYGHEGQAVTRTGKKSLHALGAIEMAGMSRAKVEAAVDAARRFGRLEVNSDSTLTVVVEG